MREKVDLELVETSWSTFCSSDD